MKNDYTGGGVKISIPPTVLFTVMGFVPDVSRVVTSDFKQPGDLVYVLGVTRAELGASELASELGFTSPDVPQVEALSARRAYKTLHAAMRQGLVTACHDCSDGGLAVALAEMAIGGRLGASLDLTAAPAPVSLSELELLYAESQSRLVVTIAPEHQAAFEELFTGQPLGLLGAVTEKPVLILGRNGQQLCAEDVEGLVRAFRPHSTGNVFPGRRPSGGGPPGFSARRRAARTITESPAFGGQSVSPRGESPLSAHLDKFVQTNI